MTPVSPCHCVALQMCTDGVGCKRRVCFFAHAEAELRKPEEDPVWLQQQMQSEMQAGGMGERGRGLAQASEAFAHCRSHALPADWLGRSRWSNAWLT